MYCKQGTRFTPIPIFPITMSSLLAGVDASPISHESISWQINTVFIILITMNAVLLMIVIFWLYCWRFWCCRQLQRDNNLLPLATRKNPYPEDNENRTNILSKNFVMEKVK
jgi:hypothetical protein